MALKATKAEVWAATIEDRVPGWLRGWAREAVLDVAETALRRGTRALCVISAGFAEIGEEGRTRQDELLALVRAHGAPLDRHRRRPAALRRRVQPLVGPVGADGAGVGRRSRASARGLNDGGRPDVLGSRRVGARRRLALLVDPDRDADHRDAASIRGYGEAALQEGIWLNARRIGKFQMRDFT